MSRNGSAEGAGWDAAAARKWEGLSEAGRSEWRTLVRSRRPELAHCRNFMEAWAVAWCYDPSFVSPLRADPPPGLNRRLAHAVRPR